MAYETAHAGDYPEAAGWALGTLSGEDKAAFGEHLRSCGYCQAQVAGFAPVARALTRAAPAAEPPGDLELKVIAAVQYATLAGGAGGALLASPPSPSPAPAAAAAARAPAARKPGAKTRAHRWWHFHWTSPLYASLAGAAVIVAVVAGSMLLRSAPAPAATFSLRAQPGFAGSAAATARAARGGFAITLTVNGLPAPAPGQFYECWYAGPDSEPGHPDLVTAGTFTVTGPGAQTVSMWSAADPSRFKIMQITLEEPGDAAQHGEVILSGAARSLSR